MLLSVHQKNAIRILRAKLQEARLNYLEAIERRFQLFNIEPNKDVDFPAWSKWHARFKLACDDVFKTYNNYNKAYNSYTSYKGVALGVY